MSKATTPEPAEEAPAAEAVFEAVEEQPAPLPAHKDDLVALAIDRGIPSYEAWNLTVPELTKRLES